MTRLTRIACTAGVALALIVTVDAHAAPNAKAPVAKLAPAVQCTMANRLDVFVDEDNIMWACECEALSSGFICRWQVIGGVDAVNTRKRIKHKLHLRFVPQMRLLVLA